jgi:hypothetical protein
VKNFPGAWAKATTPAGVRGLLFMISAALLPATCAAEGAIMKIGGWRTRSVFERYAIVSQADIADALKKHGAS